MRRVLVCWGWMLIGATLVFGQLSATDEPTVCRLVAAAVARTRVPVIYDGSYRAIPYPGGDVPDHIGVRTDLVIRSYRAVGVDLQRRVHEDMRLHFEAYPRGWGLAAPDPNIDHRRVLNLEVFFRRMGAALPGEQRPEAYGPGDLVTWRLPDGRPHIGLVCDQRSADGRRWLVVHNIGQGPEVADVLFRWPVTGHFRYHPWME